MGDKNRQRRDELQRVACIFLSAIPSENDTKPFDFDILLQRHSEARMALQCPDGELDVKVGGGALLGDADAGDVFF